MNGGVYREHCIHQRLVPFIREMHANEIVFWSDLGCVHTMLALPLP